MWGFDTLPISPFFLAFLFKDFVHATAPEFVNAVAPQAAKRLASWPPKAIGPPSEDGTPPRVVLDGTMDLMTLVFEWVPNVTVCYTNLFMIPGAYSNFLQADHIRDMSLENQMELLPSTKAGLLFAH